MEIVNTEEENLHIFWPPWGASTKSSEKMWFMIILKVTKKQSLTLSLRNAICEKPEGGIKLTLQPPPPPPLPPPPTLFKQVDSSNRQKMDDCFLWFGFCLNTRKKRYNKFSEKLQLFKQIWSTVRFEVQSTTNKSVIISLCKTVLSKAQC